MTDASDALSALLHATVESRDLHHDAEAAVDRARALVYETNWQARAAESFRRTVRRLTADLVAIRIDLADLEGETASVADRLQVRVGHAVGGQPG